MRDVRRIPRVSADEERRLGLAIKAGGQDAEAAADRLVSANLRLVARFARRGPESVPLLDRIQEGNLALMRAAKDFDPDRGSFSTHAVPRIRMQISRSLSKERVVHIPVNVTDAARSFELVASRVAQATGETPSPSQTAAAAGVDRVRFDRLCGGAGLEVRSLDEDVSADKDGGLRLHDVVGDEAAESPEENAIRSELREQVREALDTLPPRQRQVMELRFGIRCVRDHALQEVADAVGMTREGVRQSEAAAMKKLRFRLAGVAPKSGVSEKVVPSVEMREAV